MKVKKLLTGILAGVFTLAMTTVAFAKEIEPKNADVTLTVTQTVNVDSLKVGQPISLEVSALKKGSACTAVWSIAGLNKDGTTFTVPSTNYTVIGDTTASVVTTVDPATALPIDDWVANGTFTGNVAGTYQITATLTMTAGKSDVSWTGSDSVNVTVVNPVIVTGFVAKNFAATPKWNSKHTNITGYDVTYDLYIQYSDNSEKIYKSLESSMGAGQKSYSLSIVYTDGKTYPYTVTNPLK